ncbi:unnamed protein product, partial [Rhizoctonia solani]
MTVSLRSWPPLLVRLSAAAAIFPRPLTLPLQPLLPPVVPTLHPWSPRVPFVSLASLTATVLLAS